MKRKSDLSCKGYPVSANFTTDTFRTAFQFNFFIKLQTGSTLLTLDFNSHSALHKITPSLFLHSIPCSK